MAKGKRLGAQERKELIESSAHERKKVFEELLRHLRAGYCIDSFGPLSRAAIFLYIDRFPGDFVMSELEQAQRDGYAGWEQIGRRQAEGTCLGNSRSWYYNMSNRYGWRERAEVATEHSGSVAVQVVSYASQKASTQQ